MRHPRLKMGEAAALRWLAEAPLHHLATTRSDGTPVVRALQGVLLGDWLLFHGSKAGEKSRCLGQPAVVSAERVVANLPSYFIDPQYACPATTLYVSAQATGVLEDVTDPGSKAGFLAALMLKYQPEGGYAPLDPTVGDYRKAIKGVRVFGLRIQRVSGKSKLGQNKPTEYVERVLEGLWQRGAPGDLEAMRELMELHPQATPPPALRGPSGVHLEVSLRETDRDVVLGLLAGQYWLKGIPPKVVWGAHQRSTAWVGARLRTHDGRLGSLIGTARALSDGSRLAHLSDVAVHSEHQSRGVGRALLRGLLDHPALRGVRTVSLTTTDKQSFYGHFGFCDATELRYSFPLTLLVRTRQNVAYSASSHAVR